MSRRRSLRVVVPAAVALVALVVTGFFALPEIVRRLTLWRLAATTGRQVALARADVDVLDGRVALHGLRVLDHDQRPLATVARLEFRFSLRELLRGHLRVTDATLDAPTVRLVRTGPREFNISDLLPGEGAAQGALDVTLERLLLRDGSAEVEDRTLTPSRVWRVARVALEMREVSTRPSAPPGVLTASAVVADSPVSLWVTDLGLHPLRFTATVIARQIDASLLGLHFPPESPLRPARGAVNASGTIERDAAGGTRVALDASLTDLTLRQPGGDAVSVSAPSVRVRVEDLRLRPGGALLGRLAVDGGTVVLEDRRLARVRRWQADGVAFEVRDVSSAREDPAGVATARAVVAGSPLSVWVSELRLAPIELSAMAIVRDVDVTPLELYLAADLPVRPERGVVNASVRVAHDGRLGTRLAVDATLRSLELRRPAHLVTAPSLRVIAEDITFGRGAVAVGRAAVRGERLTIEDGTLTPARVWRVQNLEVEASRLSSRREDVQGVATARATIEGAALSAWLTRLRLDPLELHATAILRDVDLALLRLYLPRGAPLAPERGLVNASLQIEHTAAGGTRLDADVSLAGVEARAPGPAGLSVAAPALRVTLGEVRRRGEALGVARFELNGHGRLADRRVSARFDFERLRVAAEDLAWPARGPARIEVSARLRDGGELNATGVAELVAPPPDLAWKMELGMRLEALDLASLAAVAPLARGLDGRMRADVTASIAAADAFTARVRGDAGLSSLVFRVDGRTLLAAQRVHAGGLDVSWPHRVAVAQLRLVEPHAVIERDRRGGFLLAARLAAPAATGSPPRDTGRAPPAQPEISIGEVVVERGSVALADESAAEPARLEVPRVDLTLRDVTWPERVPARLSLDAALPAGGALTVEGTVGAEPARVDLRLALKNAQAGLLQPYLGFPARVRARVDATVAVAGALTPAPRLTLRGDGGLRRLRISDGRRDVLTVGRIDVTGIDAGWPDRVTIDRLHVRDSWALIERDRDNRFLLRALFERLPTARGPAPPPAAERAAPTVSLVVREGIFEGGAATIVDEITTPPARFDVAGARLTVHDFAWPPRGPMRLGLTSPMPEGGTLGVEGTLAIEPLHLEGRVVLEDVQLGPAQPYLPIEGRVTGRMTGEVALTVGLEPLSVRLRGQTSLRRFRLSDGDRPLVTARRVDALGIDVAWPERASIQSLQISRPRLLIERDAGGGLLLQRLATPRRAIAPASTSPPAARPRAATIEVGAVSLDRASVRFVDHRTTPAFTEDLSAVNVSVTGLGTVQDRPVHVTATGALPGGASFALRGEFGLGEPRRLELKVDVRDYVLPRANAYLEQLTSWMASRGQLSISARYALAGTRLDAHHDLVLRHLEVEPAGEDDEVERRLGLPLGFLVSIMKDARGEIQLSVPVSGDLGSGDFDFQETVWAVVRNLTIRLLALPFARVGSLFFSEDSKVEAVAIDPVFFEAGTASVKSGMGPHLDRVAAFLRNAPSIGVVLVPRLTVADAEVLKRAPARTEAPNEALRELATRRLEVVRQALANGGVDPGRLGAPARRVPLVEAAGDGRVEFDLGP